MRGPRAKRISSGPEGNAWITTAKGEIFQLSEG